MIATCPQALLDASETFVGLPDGQMGNSEVGHMNIGAGRVVVPRICRASTRRSTTARSPERAAGRISPPPLQARAAARAHLMGLLSPGGVHSHQDHIAALAKMLAGAGVTGLRARFSRRPRHAAQKRAECFARRSSGSDVAGLPGVRIATVSGRYYAMDRDKRWDRVEKAYDAMVDAEGTRAARRRRAANRASYAAGDTDEFVLPDRDRRLCRHERRRRRADVPISAPTGCARFCGALLDPDFDGFPRRRLVTLRCRRRHDRIFGGAEPLHGDAVSARGSCSRRPSARWSSRAGLKQLRIAETEKYAHVTFFFNGGARRGIPRRGAHPGALAQGRDLRSASPRCRRPKSPTSWSRRSAARPVRRRSSSTTPTPTWSGHTGDLTAADQGGRDGRCNAWAGWRRP